MVSMLGGDRGVPLDALLGDGVATTDVKRRGDTDVEFLLSPKPSHSGSMIPLMKLSGGG